MKIVPEFTTVENTKTENWDGPFSFIQLADPQFGCHEQLSGKTEKEAAFERVRGRNKIATPKIEGFEIESRLFRKAISETNRLQPDFVVTCGDIINRWDNEAQVHEAKTIASDLAYGIPMHWVPGNHDVIDIGSGWKRPTEDTLNCYKARFGPDFYAFQHRGVSFIVINSSLIFHLEPELEHHWQPQLRFLETELKAANQRNSTHTIVFGHYPFFLHHPDEDWSKDDLEIGLVIPLERRSIVLELFNQYSVSAVFTGHTHKNQYTSYGTTQMVTSSAVGYPLGNDPPGYRIVRIYEEDIKHDFYGFDEGPNRIEF